MNWNLLLTDGSGQSVTTTHPGQGTAQIRSRIDVKIGHY